MSRGRAESKTHHDQHTDQHTGRVDVTLLKSWRYKQASWKKQRREKASFSAGELRPRATSDLPPPPITQEAGGIPGKQVILPEARFNDLPPPKKQKRKKKATREYS